MASTAPKSATDLEAFAPIEVLAPDKEVRDLQRLADARAGDTKAGRSEMTHCFVEAYRRLHLGRFDAARFLEALGPKASRVALFCVEAEPGACHRSLVADFLAQEFGLEVVHLR